MKLVDKGPAALATLALVICLGAPLQAQDYPNRPIVLVVPYAAGGGNDVMARVAAEKMSKTLGQQIVIENRGGAGGTIATRAMAKSAPDGYTLVIGGTGTLAINPTLYPNAGYDPRKDFAPVGLIATGALVVLVHPSVPAHSIGELIAHAKKEPGKLNFSSPGLASTTFIAGALFRKAAGVDIVHVPFRSAPDAVTAVIRGDAQFYFAPINLARDQSEAGKVRAIAAATAKRIPELPNVPTFTEAGLPFVYDSWFGLMAPAGVPQPILEKISKDWAEAIKTPEMEARIKGQYLIGVSDTPSAMDKIVKDETATLTETFKQAGIGG